MSGLFAIETNHAFPMRTAAVAPLGSVVHAFGFDPPAQAVELEKHNRLSRLIVADLSARRVVFRSCAQELASRIELQSEIFAALEGVNVLRPLKTANGQHVVVAGDEAWIAYDYIEGPLYCAPGEPPMVAVEAALKCLAALRVFERKHPAMATALPRIAHAVDPLIVQRLSDRTDGVLDAWTLESLKLAEPEIISLARACSAVDDTVGLAHSDLQHANLVASANGTFVIDLEDVSLDEQGLCAAHAIFKLIRHAVFLGVASRENARAKLVPQAIAMAQEMGLLAAGGSDVLRLAARRTFGDVTAILTASQRPETRWYLYDLKKKVHNLFEIAYLFGQPMKEAV